MLQTTALQVGIKRLTNMPGELLSGIGQMLDKGRIMTLDDLVEQRLLGSGRSPSIARRNGC